MQYSDIMQHLPKRVFLLRTLIIAALAVAGFSAAQAQDAGPGFSLKTMTVKPVMPEELAKRKAPSRTLEEMGEMRERVEERREETERRLRKLPLNALTPIADPSIRPVKIVSNAEKAPGGSGGNSLFIGRNERNRLAQFSGALSEPAAINNRGNVYYSGNFHTEVSTDHGETYTNVDIPPGPDDAPFFCCDIDMTVDSATGTGIEIVLYIDGADNGVLAVNIRDANDYSAIKCSYVLDSAGAADDELMDYAKISQSKNMIYVSASILGPNAGYSRMHRILKSEMLNCQDIGIEVFDQQWSLEGQRVWRPAGGAEQSRNMMWAHYIDESHMRVFKWSELDGAPDSIVRSVSPVVFGDAACKGGVGNFGYYEGSFPAGFDMSCTMASGIAQTPQIFTCFKHSLPVINRPQPFLRGTTFKVADRSLIAEPDLYSEDMCWGIPIMSSNSRGDIGISLAGGGSVEGKGSAVQGFVGIRTAAGTEVGVVAGGIANQASGRYGDYFTIHRYQGCPKFFGATSYAWDKAPVTDGAGINARWVEFGRFGDAACWQKNQ